MQFGIRLNFYKVAREISVGYFELSCNAFSYDQNGVIRQENERFLVRKSPGQTPPMQKRRNSGPHADRGRRIPCPKNRRSARSRRPSEGLIAGVTNRGIIEDRGIFENSRKT
ncbi:hypothetical protein PUN28_016171 [Cardiocondyla obscurior]|uniref:Uncharacterized protein n=1 Tax=Cardiocondyla obscurior TaxID=286306 RepID=A0AAW2EWJ0_9HYME